MSSTFDFENVQPGVISAVLFIFLDIFTVGILDIVLARVVCLAYYRSISEGKPVSVKSADIPGLSNYLLGRSLSWINLSAIIAKLALLGVVLTANISIGSKDSITKVEYRNATFKLSPSDAHISKNYTYTVRRRQESSKSCFQEKNEILTYYSLRFNLQDNEIVESDYGKPGEKGKYDVNDSSIICMSPEEVSESDELIVVEGCTRINKTEKQSCLTVVSQNVTKPVTIEYEKENAEIYKGEITHEYRDYDPEGVKRTFKEYRNPRLTCLSTQIGIDSSEDPSTYTHCLLVAIENRTKSDGSNRTVTIVERWILGPDKDNSSKTNFIMEYPGIIFTGKFDIGRLASARYLQLPFPFTDYRTLSGELIAQASDYEYLGKQPSKRRIGKLEKAKLVTTIGRYAVIMVAVSVIFVLVSFLITSLILCMDKRPRFNTINGLSSIVREEHVPSGRSYSTGESAILGLRFTTDDKMHFGPLKSYEEGQAFQDGYDIS